MPRFSRCAGSAILFLINIDGLLIEEERKEDKNSIRKKFDKEKENNGMEEMLAFLCST
jgi:hypothetical protein